MKTPEVRGQRSEVRGQRPEVAAFSLIEIMVTIALLSFIVLGLLAMFNQTQRAFRSSMTQVDVLEAGRAVVDMVARDMEQMVATEFQYAYLNGRTVPVVNFSAEFSGLLQEPVFQGLPGTVNSVRTNVFQDIFFVTKQGLDYTAVGYQVRPDFTNANPQAKPVFGTLYRFSVAHTKRVATSTNLSAEFQLTASLPIGAALPRNISRIADGLVHFRVRAYDTNGFPFALFNYTNAMFRTNGYGATYGTAADYSRMGNSMITALPGYPDQLNYYFFSNAVPAYLELEVGFLEPHILDRLRAIGNGNPTAQYQYLSNHVANVHLFRRRIPIRNVDFLAYQ